MGSTVPPPHMAQTAVTRVTPRLGSRRGHHGAGVESGHDHGRRGTTLADRLADGAVLRVVLSGVRDVETPDRSPVVGHEIHEVDGEDGLGMRRAKDMILLD